MAACQEEDSERSDKDTLLPVNPVLLPQRPPRLHEFLNQPW